MRVIIGLIIGGLLLHCNGLAHADFDEGLAAYERGDYSAAIKEFRILAEQGEADAQTNLYALLQQHPELAKQQPTASPAPLS